MKTFTQGHDLLDTSTKFMLKKAHIWVKVLMFQTGEGDKKKTERVTAKASDENMFGPASHPCLDAHQLAKFDQMPLVKCSSMCTPTLSTS